MSGKTSQQQKEKKQQEVENSDPFHAYLDKKNRNSNKKLKQIKELEDKKKQGEQLT